MADIERGLEKLRHTAPEETIRSQLMYPLITTLVADARGRSGDAEKGLAILPEAIAVIERLGARYCEPIVYRVRGDLLAQLEHRAEAEISLGKSIELARASGARSLELQATISLARLQPNGERALSARAALGDLLEVFTEGNDSNDLRSARALFAELT